MISASQQYVHVQTEAILSKRASFGSFVIANTLAFCLSSLSIFLHFFTPFVRQRELLFHATKSTVSLTIYATAAMVIAFISGSYAVLADSSGLAIAAVSIGCSYFALTYLMAVSTLMC